MGPESSPLPAILDPFGYTRQLKRVLQWQACFIKDYCMFSLCSNRVGLTHYDYPENLQPWKGWTLNNPRLDRGLWWHEWCVYTTPKGLNQAALSSWCEQLVGNSGFKKCRTQIFNPFRVACNVLYGTLIHRLHRWLFIFNPFGVFRGLKRWISIH